MKTLSDLSDRKLNKHIAKLESDLVAAKLAMRTQKAGALQRELFAARIVRMRRAAEKNERKSA
jgi:hypothetical protein